MEGCRIGVLGCAGRMGRMIVKQIHESEGCVLAGGSELPGSEAIGQDLGELAGIGPVGQSVGDDPLALFARCEAAVDFTAPASSVENAALAAQAQVAYVIGTTGLDAEQEAAIDRCGYHTPIVRAANMSLGVNLLLDLVEQVARALDPNYDIEILEMHHRLKADAPSGTALALGRAAASGRGVEFEAVAERGRDGITGERRRGAIGFAVLRGGDVVGDHSVVFAGPGERIELTHKAASREVFAAGAVRAALWAREQRPGLYTMRDVLGLKRPEEGKRDR